MSLILQKEKKGAGKIFFIEFLSTRTKDEAERKEKKLVKVESLDKIVFYCRLLLISRLFFLQGWEDKKKKIGEILLIFRRCLLSLSALLLKLFFMLLR